MAEIERICQADVEVYKQVAKYLDRKLKNTGYKVLFLHKKSPPKDGDTITFMGKHIATWQTLKS